MATTQQPGKMSALVVGPQYEGDSSIFESFSHSVHAFSTFLMLLHEEDCQPTRLQQVNLTSILEEFGRLKIWGDQTKADLPPLARGSLDDTLRHDGELKELVKGILFRVRVLFGEALPLVDSVCDVSESYDRDSAASDSDTSEFDTEEESCRGRRTMPRIPVLVKRITDQIQSLYGVSAVLRRPSIANKYLRSIKRRPKGVVDAASPSSLLEATFISYDKRHVAEKCNMWRGMTKSCRHAPEFPMEDAATHNIGVSADHPELMEDCKDIWWLCERLAAANTRRREQLDYWVHHPYLKLDEPEFPALEDGPGAGFPFKQSAGDNKQDQQAGEEDLGGHSKGKEGKESKIGSMFSKPSFSAAAFSDVHETNTNVRPRTVYARTTTTAAAKGRFRSVPNPPKATSDGPTFTCPYCGMKFDYSAMEKRESWKRHVFRDLRPYVCTFQDCQNAGKLYVSRNEWMYHELQVHRRRFVCIDCHAVYTDRQSMINHLKEHYGESVAQSRLEIILDICNSEVDESSKDSCIICGQELPLGDLQAHLATHMEDLAIFVLPTVAEDDDNRLSQASEEAATQSSGETSLLGLEKLTIDDDGPNEFQKDEDLGSALGDDDDETNREAWNTFRRMNEPQPIDSNWGE